MKNRKRSRDFTPKRSAPPPRIRAQSKPSAAPETEPDPVPAQLARINEISMVARTTWFGLLAYLTFVGITLLGVEDADFFVPSRQTQLPLVNVAIPTSSFFWFAPMLGAALYAYLHLQLLKLWEALAKPPPTVDGKPLSEHVYPWLISDFALSQRIDNAIPLRPLRLLSGWTTRLLVWWSAPLILGGFWWRSMPAHHEGMTLWIALCMMLTLYIGFTSRRKARIEMRKLEGHTPWQGWFRRSMFMLLCSTVIVTSWVRTEGGTDNIVFRGVTLINDVFGTKLLRQCEPEYSRPWIFGEIVCDDKNGLYIYIEFIVDERIKESPYILTISQLSGIRTPNIFNFNLKREFITDNYPWSILAKTDLSNVNLYGNRKKLFDYATEQNVFRMKWCQKNGVDREICGNLGTKSVSPPSDQVIRRTNWCGDQNRQSDPRDCLVRFDRLDDEFRAEWTQVWNSRVDEFGKLDLSGVDLRFANLSGTLMTGVNLTKARLQSADIMGARLENAILNGAQLDNALLENAKMSGASLLFSRLSEANISNARLERADLRGAWLKSARLKGAWMQEAILAEANLQYAELNSAIMQGANLDRASLVDADFRRARLEGADLSGARVRGADFSFSDLRSAKLNESFSGANVSAADLRSDHITQQMLNNVFGDVETKIPDGLVMPDHWNDEPRNPVSSFDPRFQAWLDAGSPSGMPRPWLHQGIPNGPH